MENFIIEISLKCNVARKNRIPNLARKIHKDSDISDESLRICKRLRRGKKAFQGECKSCVKLQRYERT